MPGQAADRNLLFGILALQMDFITRDALIAAMHAWVLEKHRPIGEILVERGDLDPTDRTLLGVIVDRHLARHGGDPVASLAALSSIDSTASSLCRSITDPEVLGSLNHLAEDPPTDSRSTLAYMPRDSQPAGVRYRKVRDHAEGGLGIVFVARDEELNREVALKEIQGRHADDPDKRARFMIEAEITGRLEHPGIVPVYGLGCYDDGRPFYAMRFIKGDSLKDAIAAFHADETWKRNPGARALALQKLLRRFLDVCNTMAYAHSRGILHRDLKPANVMVGKYGETLVVDWGLAKATGRSDRDDSSPPPESTMLAPSSGGSSETLPGTRVGTPAYMSPEQAAGRLDLLGPASDVYSLGATLYTLLTGQRAITGDDLQEIYRKIEHGDFPRPRVSSPWLDPALEAICLKAMALRPLDRYPSTKALADDVERWLADEPVTAYREPWARKARRWRRKHRTAVTSTVAVAAVAAILLCVYAWQRIDQRRRIDGSALAAIGQAEGLAVGARASGKPGDWDKAIAEARLAKDRLEAGGSPTVLREVMARLEAFQAEKSRLDAAIEADRKDSQVVADLEEARLRGADLKDNHFDFIAKHEAYLAAFRAYGIDVGSLPVEEASKRIRSSKVGDELISALDDWSRFQIGSVPQERLLSIARASETDPTRASIREAVARRDIAALRRLCERAEDRRHLGPRARSVFNALLQLGPTGSFPLLEAIRGENPSDFWLNHDLGVAYSNAKTPQFPEAVRYLIVAVALRPESPGVRFNLGRALHGTGDLDGAIAEYRKAIDLDPKYANAHGNLGVSLYDKGDRDAAIAECRKTIDLDPKVALPHNNLGIALYAKGDLDAAIAEYRNAFDLAPYFASAHSILGIALYAKGDLDAAIAEQRKAIDLDPKFASAHGNLGVSLYDKGDRDGAIAEQRKAIDLDPKDAHPHYSIGVALFATGDRDGAIAEYRKAIDLDPKDARVHYNLGIALKDKGDLDAAIAEYRKAIDLDPGYVEAHGNLGIALKDKGDLDAAIAEYRKAIDLEPKLAQAHNNLGATLYVKGDLDGAIAECRKAIDLDPKDPKLALAHNNLGAALYDKGDLEGAIAECRKAIELEPKLARTHWTLGRALYDKGDRDGAIAECRKAIELDPKHASAHNTLGIALKDEGDLDGGIAEYRKAIELDPKYAGAYCNLGLALKQRGHFAEALEYLQKGHELGSRRPGWTYPSAQWVSECRRLVELEQKLPVFLKGEVSPRDADERLILADLCYQKALHAASARFYGQAFADQPTLAEDLRTGHRYNAACEAALAGSGTGKDDPPPGEASRARFREQALGWLRADLAAHGKVLDGGDANARQALFKELDHWKKYTDLAGIRDEAALAKLAEGEREAFRALWADVEALRVKAGGGK